MSQRQLAAIMFTDIVGYTALMGKDTQKALEIVRISKEIQKPLVEKHNGKWLKEMGDGAMAQFSTALDAVNCSIEIQEIARGKLDAKLRIGIHLGDVTVEEDDVHGDGVNVASRLESIADPGGIYVSDAIEKAIRGQSDVQAKLLGEVSLKNVDYGVKTYALQGVGLPVPEVKDEKELSGHFLAELQRRGVIRAGVAYTVVTLLLILLFRELQNWLMLPELSLPILTTALVVGFPLAMYFAWNYERSPEGFVRTTSRESWQNPYSTSQRKPLTSNFIIAGMAFIIVAMYVYPRYLTNPSGDDGARPGRIIDEKSIAVLPFDNFSEDKEKNQHICDGVMVAVRNNLSRIQNLRVTPHTSVEQYRAKTASTFDIGQSLNVSYLLQGSVQRLADRLRIDVALVNTLEDRVIWNDSFEDDYSNLFEIQSRIASVVAAQLEIILTPEEKDRIEQVPTANLDAWELYLKGDATYMNMLFEARYNDYDSAMNYFRHALALDPGLSEAYTGMAKTYWYVNWDVEYLKENFMDSVLFWCEKSLEIDAYESEAYALLGSYYSRTGEDNQALEQYKKAFELDPNNSRVMFDFGRLLCFSRDYKNGFRAMYEAIRSDPQSIWLADMYMLLGDEYMSIGNYDKSRALFKLAINLSTSLKDSINAIWGLSHSYLMTGDAEEALEYALLRLEIDPRASRLIGEIYCVYLDRCEEGEAEIAKTVDLVPDDFGNRQRLGMAKIINGKREEGMAIIKEELKDWKQAYSLGRASLYDIAGMNAFLGNREEAYHYLEMLNETNGWQYGLQDYTEFDPFFDSIRHEPRFRKIMGETQAWMDSVRTVVVRLDFEDGFLY